MVKCRHSFAVVCPLGGVLNNPIGTQVHIEARSKSLYPSVPDSTSLKNALEMGYAVTPTGLAWPGNKGWEKPNGSPFPIPALIFAIESNWRPNGVAYV